MTERISAKQYLSGEYSSPSAASKAVSCVRITLTRMPPSANAMRKHFLRSGKIVSVKSDEYATWLTCALSEIMTQRAGHIDGPYTLSIAAQRHWRSKRARDIDNLLKPLSDALVKAGVVADDSLAESVSARWADDLHGHAVIIIVQEANEALAA